MIRALSVCIVWFLSLPVWADMPAYVLNPGDVLDVSVWKEPDLQREVLVLPDGTISFPLVGNVQAAGRTPTDVQKLITAQLSKYIPEPVVTVSVLSTSGNKVYVIGQVNQPGEFLAARPIDVMQALSLAGGLTEFAGEGRIVVLRREGGNQVAYPFDYDAVKKGSNTKSNIVLHAGDVVVVPGEGIF